MNGDKIKAALDAVDDIIDILTSEGMSFQVAQKIAPKIKRIRAALSEPDQPALLDAEVQEAIARLKDGYMEWLTSGIYMDAIALLERHIAGLTEKTNGLRDLWETSETGRIDAIDDLTAEREAHEQTKKERDRFATFLYEHAVPIQTWYGNGVSTIRYYTRDQWLAWVGGEK